ncbi:winged helix-turn-helix domain-containing protein [Halobaculum sp. D14]|uniref:winged helix-turn-helix domain-containing protein n=1 Tax=Halobaculum sp. D14 TaxID=3421642 RepID=UPI003EB6D42E
MSGKMQSQPNEESLASEGAIATLFSGPARTRVIEAFVANASRELNVSDIARLSDTARSTVYRHLDELQDLGLIKEFGEEGGKRYTLDEEDELATLLRKVEGVTLQRLLDMQTED